jgi:hypothetical protein
VLLWFRKNTEKEGIKMKVFLDDVREAPNGWVRTKTVRETIDIIKHNRVQNLSLDHDLGKEETGYDVLRWLEKSVAMEEIDYVPEVILVHSANPVGRSRMEQAIKSIMRLRSKTKIGNDEKWINDP